MAKGKEIVLGLEPRGRYEGCIISGTPYPGMLLEIVPATAPVNGRFTYRARSITAGAKGPIAVLLADTDQGKLGVGAALSPGGHAVGDAYVDGKLATIYWPEAGEELNLLVGSVAGTADDVAIGDLFGVNNDGKLKANNSYGSAPFLALEVVTDPTADYMMWVKYLGNNA